jgi:uridine phosphorylase
MDNLYHVGFGLGDLPSPPPRLAFLSGDPDRATAIATTRLTDPRLLSDHRGLTSYVGTLDGTAVLSCTSGMGGPSASIVFNELAQLGVGTVIRIGTCGSIQDHVSPGDVVITSASLCRQGSALDIAPVEYPAAADPFLTVTLADAAATVGVRAHVGLTASVDTFFEGQERSATSANPHLLRSLRDQTTEYRSLHILNYEMESGTLFKAGLVYGIAVGCVCAVIAQRTVDEQVRMDAKGAAVDDAIDVAVEAARLWLSGRDRR